MKLTFISVSILIAICSVFFLFKTEVSSLEKKIAVLNNSINDDKMAIHVLNAELAHLNEPDRIRMLVRKHTRLREISAEQIKGYNIFSKKKPNIKKVSY